MPQNLLACHGVLGLVCAVGENGRILHFEGDVYRPMEVESPTNRTLRGVWVESRYSAWACGDAGTVLHWNGARSVAADRRHAPGRAPGHLGPSCRWGMDRRQEVPAQPPPTHGGTLIDSDAEILAIWGSGPDDIWYLCAGRLVLHWTGERCERIDLPGDDDEEWTAVAGADGAVYLCGPSGFLLRFDGAAWTADYAMILKQYGDPAETKDDIRYSRSKCTSSEKVPLTGAPDPDKISTSYVERQNMTMRMSMRRATRLTNGFSKKLLNHCAAISLYVAHYNFVRVHQTLRMTPAQALGVTDHAWSIGELIDTAFSIAPERPLPEIRPVLYQPRDRQLDLFDRPPEEAKPERGAQLSFFVA